MPAPTMFYIRLVNRPYVVRGCVKLHSKQTYRTTDNIYIYEKSQLNTLVCKCDALLGEHERVVWSICVAQAISFQSLSTQSAHNCECLHRYNLEAEQCKQDTKKEIIQHFEQQIEALTVIQGDPRGTCTCSPYSPCLHGCMYGWGSVTFKPSISFFRGLSCQSVSHLL